MNLSGVSRADARLGELGEGQLLVDAVASTVVPGDLGPSRAPPRRCGNKPRRERHELVEQLRRSLARCQYLSGRASGTGAFVGGRGGRASDPPSSAEGALTEGDSPASGRRWRAKPAGSVAPKCARMVTRLASRTVSRCTEIGRRPIIWRRKDYLPREPVRRRDFLDSLARYTLPRIRRAAASQPPFQAN
jgi:hypothetical protein